MVQVVLGAGSSGYITIGAHLSARGEAHTCHQGVRSPQWSERCTCPQGPLRVLVPRACPHWSTKGPRSALVHRLLGAYLSQGARRAYLSKRVHQGLGVTGLSQRSHWVTCVAGCLSLNKVSPGHVCQLRNLDMDFKVRLFA